MMLGKDEAGALHRLVTYEEREIKIVSSKSLWKRVAGSCCAQITLRNERLEITFHIFDKVLR